MSAAARVRAPALLAGLRRLGTSATEAERKRGARWELSAAREYYDYRKSIYGDVTHRALLVDAVGTLVVPAQPTAQVYKSIGEKYGVKFSEEEILMRYRWAYGQPWGRSRLRYVDDGRPFWQHIVSSSTGCSDLEYFEELYQYYMTEKAWKLCDPDAEHVFQALRKAGVKTAVVSNFICPPVPACDPEATMEIRRKQAYLPADLLAYPAYAIDSDQWLNWRGLETDPRRKAGFLGDMDYPFGPPPRPARPVAPRHGRQQSPDAPP